MAGSCVSGSSDWAGGKLACLLGLLGLGACRPPNLAVCLPLCPAGDSASWVQLRWAAGASTLLLLLKVLRCRDQLGRRCCRSCTCTLELPSAAVSLLQSFPA